MTFVVHFPLERHEGYSFQSHSTFNRAEEAELIHCQQKQAALLLPGALPKKQYH
jgi:hypothetical protein